MTRAPDAPQARTLIVPCRCGVRTCPGCANAWGARLRQNLLTKSERFTHPRLLTTNIDPCRFPSPLAAYQKVTKGKLVRRLMKRLGIARWVWVMEFHASGWPHWHVMYDAADLPGHRIDLKLARHLWHDTWHLGEIHLAEGRGQTNDVAFRSIVSYLSKPAAAYPEWVVNTPGIRFANASRSVGPLMATARRSVRAKAPRPARRYARRRTPAARLAACGQSCKALQERIDHDTGERHVVYLATLPVSPQRLVEMSETGEIPGRVTTATVDGRSVTRLESGDAHEIRQTLEELHGAARDEPRPSYASSPLRPVLEPPRPNPRIRGQTRRAASGSTLGDCRQHARPTAAGRGPIFLL